MKSSIEASLIEPQTEVVSGQTQLKPLDAGERVKIILGVCARKVGQFQLLLAFPYWADRPPPRYEYAMINISVVKPLSISIENSVSGLQVMCPPGFWAVGFTGPYPDLDRHLLVVDGRFCLLDFACEENKNERTEIEEYCRPFIDESRLSFWYQDCEGFVSMPIKPPPTMLAIVLIRNQEKCQLEVTNLEDVALGETFVKVEQSLQRLDYILTGITRQRFADLGPRKTVCFEFGLIAMANQFVIPVEVETLTFSGIYQLICDTIE
jgi:hypothetical protein